MTTPNRPALGRVPRHVARALDRCEPWRGHVDPQGYGRAKVRGRTVYAHRLAYAQFYGTLRPGQRVYHLCGARACVNPLHLTTEPPEQERRLPGTAKLSPRKVRAIRKGWAEPNRPTQAALAKRYAVSRSCISLIVCGVTWTDV